MSDKWNQMSEAQKKTTFDSLPAEQTKGQSYTEWIKQGYHHQYENWMPWIEDQYLKWFTKDNKASYATKGTQSRLVFVMEQLDKTKVTGIEQVDNLQDGVNNLVGGQVGKGGLGQPIGDAVSKEGVNRVERGGKDDNGSYGGPLGGVTDPIAEHGSAAAGKVTEGAKGAAGYVGGLLGGKK
ncbi:hypothetical protein LTR50_005443 [Elasticomyces elasticus]|nr:hypothetical protein LTR50_005443 [Elasticomyces elasticus]